MRDGFTMPMLSVPLLCHEVEWLKHSFVQWMCTKVYVRLRVCACSASSSWACVWVWWSTQESSYPFVNGIYLSKSTHCIRIWMNQHQQYGLLKNPVARRSAECLASRRLLPPPSSPCDKINFLRLKSVGMCFVVCTVVIVNNPKFALLLISANKHGEKERWKTHRGTFRGNQNTFI